MREITIYIANNDFITNIKKIYKIYKFIKYYKDYYNVVSKDLLQDLMKSNNFKSLEEINSLIYTYLYYFLEYETALTHLNNSNIKSEEDIHYVDSNTKGIIGGVIDEDNNTTNEFNFIHNNPQLLLSALRKEVKDFNTKINDEEEVNILSNQSNNGNDQAKATTSKISITELLSQLFKNNVKETENTLVVKDFLNYFNLEPQRNDLNSIINLTSKNTGYNENDFTNNDNNVEIKLIEQLHFRKQQENSIDKESIPLNYFIEYLDLSNLSEYNYKQNKEKTYTGFFDEDYYSLIKRNKNNIISCNISSSELMFYKEIACFFEEVNKPLFDIMKIISQSSTVKSRSSLNNNNNSLNRLFLNVLDEISSSVEVVLPYSWSTSVKNITNDLIDKFYINKGPGELYFIICNDELSSEEYEHLIYKLNQANNNSNDNCNKQVRAISIQAQFNNKNISENSYFRYLPTSFFLSNKIKIRVVTLQPGEAIKIKSGIHYFTINNSTLPTTLLIYKHLNRDYSVFKKIIDPESFTTPSPFNNSLLIKIIPLLKLGLNILNKELNIIDFKLVDFYYTEIMEAFYKEKVYLDELLINIKKFQTYKVIDVFFDNKKFTVRDYFCMSCNNEVLDYYGYCRSCFTNSEYNSDLSNNRNNCNRNNLNNPHNFNYNVPNEDNFCLNKIFCLECFSKHLKNQFSNKSSVNINNCNDNNLINNNCFDPCNKLYISNIFLEDTMHLFLSRCKNLLKHEEDKIRYDLPQIEFEAQEYNEDLINHHDINNDKSSRGYLYNINNNNYEDDYINYNEDINDAVSVISRKSKTSNRTTRTKKTNKTHNSLDSFKSSITLLKNRIKNNNNRNNDKNNNKMKFKDRKSFFNYNNKYNDIELFSNDNIILNREDRDFRVLWSLYKIQHHVLIYEFSNEAITNNMIEGQDCFDFKESMIKPCFSPKRNTKFIYDIASVYNELEKNEDNDKVNHYSINNLENENAMAKDDTNININVDGEDNNNILSPKKYYLTSILSPQQYLDYNTKTCEFLDNKNNNVECEDNKLKFDNYADDAKSFHDIKSITTANNGVNEKKHKEFDLVEKIGVFDISNTLDNNEFIRKLKDNLSKDKIKEDYKGALPADILDTNNMKTNDNNINGLNNVAANEEEKDKRDNMNVNSVIESKDKSKNSKDYLKLTELIYSPQLNNSPNISPHITNYYNELDNSLSKLDKNEIKDSIKTLINEALEILKNIFNPSKSQVITKEIDINAIILASFDIFEKNKDENLIFKELKLTDRLYKIFFKAKNKELFKYKPLFTDFIDKIYYKDKKRNSSP